VFAPTYEPTLMSIGGMQITPGATYAPRRMIDPPGTILTPSATVKSRMENGCRSKKRNALPGTLPISTS